MVKKLFSYSFIVFVMLAAIGCSNSNSVDRNAKTHAIIDEAIGELQTQIDTGYRKFYPFYRKKLDSLEQVAIKEKYPNGLSRIYFMIGSMNRLRSDYDTALYWLGKSYAQVRGSNTLEEVNTLLEIGDIYFFRGKKRFTNDYYYKANKISKELDSYPAKISTYTKLATVFYHQNSFLEALQSYQFALQNIREAKYEGEHNTKEMQTLNNIALCYSRLQKYDSALRYYDTALQEAIKRNPSKDDIAKGVIMGNMGRVNQHLGNYDTAIKQLKYNISINTQKGKDLADAITSYTYLLEIYDQLDSNRAFNKYINTALRRTYDVNRATITLWRAKLFGLKANNLLKNNSVDSAYSYRTKQFNITDSLYHLSSVENLQDVLLYRQLKEQDLKLNELEESNKSQKNRIFIYLTMAMFAIVSLVLTSISLNNYRKNLKRQKQLNQQISEQNLQITLNRNELEQAIEELKLLNTEKNRLLGMVAHDLRGPIYNITGVVQLLESSEQYSKFDESDAQLIELIKKSCENALEVINDLLDAAKLDNDGIDGEMEVCNVSDIVKDVIRLYQSRATQKNIAISFFKPSGTIDIAISKEKMNRAIGNLLSNAIKFSHKNETINVTVAKTENHVLISVSDNGVGIPTADRAIIFDKFTKAKRPGTDGEKPVGLGMSIVKQIVEAHKGTIWLESEVGKGTTFYIELPLG